MPGKRVIIRIRSRQNAGVACVGNFLMTAVAVLLVIYLGMGYDSRLEIQAYYPSWTTSLAMTLLAVYVGAAASGAGFMNEKPDMNFTVYTTGVRYTVPGGMSMFLRWEDVRDVKITGWPEPSRQVTLSTPLRRVTVRGKALQDALKIRLVPDDFFDDMNLPAEQTAALNRLLPYLRTKYYV